MAHLRDLGWQELPLGAGPPAPDGPLLVAHPGHGLALLALSPAGEGRLAEDLRQRLRAGGPGIARLPLIHRSLGPGDGWRLSGILDQAFAEAPPLDRDGQAEDWIGAARRMLQPAAVPPRRSRPPALLLFWCGLLAGAGSLAAVLQLLGPPPAPPPAPMAEAALPSRQAAPGPAPALQAAPSPADAAPLPPAAQPPAPAALPPPPPAPPLLAEAAPLEAAPEGAVAPRIFVHHLPGSSAAAGALAARAARLGGSVEVRDVPFTPPTPQVRFFRPSDEALARRLAGTLGPGWRLHDLTRFSPRPRPGTLEIWLPAEE
ncbi:hypothetical protein [Falsiroseomonas tokyonensis]|uniref:LytR/CpsA/Psr regulator C-terminal domain-containing protein n=1 Tax=Falsiroseomonas tokyonensis TaxID=430521 RepID=A0ABV7BWL0_9PROT|nr:hypothetical protein [Falsiroseomonas tokyonensis]MBU8539013.1 hypothetical protein [Falsiroseomonas tokyonensis]